MKLAVDQCCNGVLHWLLIVFLVKAIYLFKETQQISRNDFPSAFVFGAGTSAYQIEGAVAEDGRTPSIWDTFTHAGKMIDKSTADVTADQYHKYKEDVKLMADLGLDAYRFSISWSRLLPKGRGTVNRKGLTYYNNLINELISHGIEPHVTLHHLDLPQILEDEYGGWLNPKIIDDFKEYADLCFKEFGDKVTYWSTLNEPNIFSIGGYDQGTIPPAHCTPWYHSRCQNGNSSVDPYIVTHNQLLAHAEVARLYKEKYKVIQKGQIGLTLLTFWMVPKTNSTEDLEATQRALDFYTGWFLDPMVFGDYPEVMKKNVGLRLPSFTKEQSELVKGSFDFLGLNHYFSYFVEDATLKIDRPPGFISDTHAIFTNNGSFQSFPVTPWGFQGILEYIQKKYDNPPVYVHENGLGMWLNSSRNDTMRADYLSAYLEFLLRAVRNGSNARGYFVWSFLDCFELLFGYQITYGLYKVDFEDQNRARYPKHSAYWYSNFLKKKRYSIGEIRLPTSYHSSQ